MIKIGERYLEVDLQEVIAKLKEDNYDMFYKTIDTPQNLMICCPFHKDGHEKKPSMGIHKKNGICHCFTCDYVGSLPEMISNIYGNDDFGRYGEKWLIKNFESIIVEERPDVELDFSRNGLSNRSIISDNPNNSGSGFVMEEELNLYRYIHPYMYERKLTDEIIEMFDVGYDRNTDSITFPVRDINGNTLFIARRAVHTKRFNYPKGVEKPVYGLYEVTKHNSIGTVTGNGNVFVKVKFSCSELIICESIIDALTCWVYGRPAVALNGTGTEYQFKQLREFPCRKYILATDNDEAGLKARKRLAKELNNKIVTEYIFPEGVKDINEMTAEQFYELQEVFV